MFVSTSQREGHPVNGARIGVSIQEANLLVVGIERLRMQGRFGNLDSDKTILNLMARLRSWGERVG